MDRQILTHKDKRLKAKWSLLLRFYDTILTTNYNGINTFSRLHKQYVKNWKIIKDKEQLTAIGT